MAGVLPYQKRVKIRSVFLVMQAALPLLLFANDTTNLVLTGKTDERTVPPIDFASIIFLPFLMKYFGIMCDIQVDKRSVCFRGDGEITAVISPHHININPISILDRGDIVSFTAIYWITNERQRPVIPSMIGLTL